jgi:eukaryotic-like serine/threonine-protein kinase
MAPLVSAPVREGDLLAGKYRVERVLGAGGMGVVVAARHIELDQLVAIKFVRDEAIASEDAVQRFLREARAAVKLKSEHVARVLDVGKLESGAPYMVMEYLEGSDLGKVLTDHGPSSVDAAADWILQACEAVAEAHAAGIVHRDLKPENLFLARSVGGGQKIKVLDFGVSKAMAGGASGEMSGLTRTRAMLGSPLYMAPEQMRSSRDVDARADVWALGVVLFQLLTNRYPFEAETMPELCLRVVTEPPLSLASLRPDVPPGIVSVIERCLEKDATKRYANAAELASALEPFVLPASRVLAERARFAMGSGAHSVPRTIARPVPSATMESASHGSTPGTSLGSTPGTSAPWGTDRVATPVPQSAKPPRSLRVPVGIAVAAIAGLAGFLVLGRGPASAGPAGSQAPAAAASDLPRAVAAPLPPVTSSTPDRPVAPVAPAEPSPAPPATAAMTANAAPGLPSHAAPSASETLAVRPSAAVPKPAAPPRVSPGKPAATDDDIPTIR